MKAQRLLLLGAGKQSDLNPARFRDLAGTAVRIARSISCRKVAFFNRGELSVPQVSRLATEGALYANYEADSYKTRNRDGQDVDSFVLVSRTGTAGEAEEGVRQGGVLGQTVSDKLFGPGAAPENGES